MWSLLVVCHSFLISASRTVKYRMCMNTLVHTSIMVSISVCKINQFILISSALAPNSAPWNSLTFPFHCLFLFVCLFSFLRQGLLLCCPRWSQNGDPLGSFAIVLTTGKPNSHYLQYITGYFWTPVHIYRSFRIAHLAYSPRVEYRLCWAGEGGVGL